MLSPVYFQRWLWLVASLRLLSVVIGFFFPNKFKSTVFNGRPDYVNPLLGRLFGTWTSLTCVLCVVCANDIANTGVYLVTLISFIVALLFFLSECFVFRTMTTKGLMSPLIVARLGGAL